ncbi:thioredoxin domain-containing protein [Elysia marginata]|uniref:Thioredoxin domain-containing protein n=1 Tax=Elysia marginata TaxID=1093978 RepID=A0AAV4I417_9GAST|nr:thioredoxin domain-containing protein [Elysia marginata]
MVMTGPLWGGASLLALVIVTLSSLCLVCGEDDNTGTIVNIDVEAWQRIHGGGRKLLLLLCVELGKSEDAALLAKLGVTNVPTLLFLRDKSHVTYDGQIDVESMLLWIPLAAEIAVQNLGDDSFEHLTQASTGATTGDWLVAFTEPRCRQVTPMLDTVGVRFKGKVNIAEVNMSDSPGLVQRFQVKECPHLIYFRKGKMYRYGLPTMDTASIRSFLDGFYKNAKAESVPIAKSQL